jgi:hypothetical protein
MHRRRFPALGCGVALATDFSVDFQDLLLPPIGK